MSKAREATATSTATCTYTLWVPTVEATQDRAAAFRRWGDAIIEFGFEVAETPVIISVERGKGIVDWYVRGGVTPAR